MKRKFITFLALVMIGSLSAGTVACAQELNVNEEVVITQEIEDETEVETEPEGEATETTEEIEEETKPKGEATETTEEIEEETKPEGEVAEKAEETQQSYEESAGAQTSESQSVEVKTEGTQPVTPVPKSKKLRVLLVGNSLTYARGNTTIRDLKMLAKKSGRKLVIKWLTYSDEKLKNWANPKNKNGKRLRREIKSKKWDYVIFQEQTSAAVTNSFYRAGKKLSSYVHQTSPKTKVMYNCTWAYKKGKKVAGKFYSFGEMQDRMNENYEKVSKDTGDRVCWSGKAFRKYRKRKGSVNMYRKDNNHGSKYGWYMNACCMYASIFGVNPMESKYYAGLNKKRAKVMQQIAAEVNLY